MFSIALGAVTAVALWGCNSGAPKVEPLTLENVEPLSREAKTRFIDDYKFRFPQTAQLLRLSLKLDHPVIRVVHVRQADHSSEVLRLAENDAVRPVLQFLEKYSAVQFEHVDMHAPPEPTPPFDKNTLLIRYEYSSENYQWVNVRTGLPEGGAFIKDGTSIRLSVWEANQEQGEESRWFEIGYTRDNDRSAKQQLAQELGLTVISERGYPFDAEREARERARYAWYPPGTDSEVGLPVPSDPQTGPEWWTPPAHGAQQRSPLQTQAVPPESQQLGAPKHVEQ